MNESISALFEGAMERTVTIAGPNGSPTVRLKLVHAAAAAAAGVVLAPRLTAAATIAALVRGVSVSIDRPITEDA